MDENTLFPNLPKFIGMEECKKVNEERGYLLSEMKQTKEQIETEWREWKHQFNQFLQLLINDGERGKQAILHAEELADAAREVLQRRKPVGLEED